MTVGSVFPSQIWSNHTLFRKSLFPYISIIHFMEKLSSCPVLNKYNNFLDLVFHFSTKTHSLSSGRGLLSPNAYRKISCPRCFRQLCRVDRSSLGRRRSYFRSHHSTRKVLIRDSNLNPLPSLLFSKRGRWG